MFRAGIEIPAGQTAENRTDIELVLRGLPEPINLEFDTQEQILYWTYREGHPIGCSLNCAKMSNLADIKNTTGKKILVRQFHGPIELKLDREHKFMYVSDMGGCVYWVGLDGVPG